VLESARIEGLLPVDWLVDPRDWTCPGAARITRILLGCRPGDILLCHDGGGHRAQTLTALAAVVPALKRRGLEFIPLAESDTQTQSHLVARTPASKRLRASS
jgi:peptidoglycan/xylan/chitin deacetylase (PgdA/CDA1 family)